MPLEPLSSIVPGLFPGLPSPAPDSGAEPRIKSARSRNRAAAWEQDLHRTYAYLAQQNLRPDERESLDRLYETALAEGPDFIHYRSRSAFAEAQELGIDRNAYARIIHALEMIERGTYRHSRKKGQQGIPRTVARVLKALLGLALKYGRVYPSYDGIARLACVCRKTAYNCIQVLKLYGFITVTRRGKRVRTALGLKTVQDSNAYTISEPTGLGALALQVFGKASECKTYAASSKEFLFTKAEERSSALDPPKRDFWGGLKEAWEAL